MNRITMLLLGAGAGLLFTGLQACSTEEPASPSRPPIPPPASTTTDGGGASSGGPGDPDGGNGSNCFDTTTQKPTTAPQFLNQCNGAGCLPFDNGTRIEGYTAGAPLPPLN